VGSDLQYGRCKQSYRYCRVELCNFRVVDEMRLGRVDPSRGKEYGVRSTKYYLQPLLVSRQKNELLVWMVSEPCGKIGPLEKYIMGSWARYRGRQCELIHDTSSIGHNMG
jgi:hypothetical protein